MITPKTVLGFLFFQKDSIMCIASSHTARWLGLVFVLSAGLAREYDGEYLIGEPWHLVLPLAASVVGCTALTLLVGLLSWSRMVRNVSLLTKFGTMLNVYWMTAPMACLYALPFERFMSPGLATRANLTLLAIVSVWRVTLMIRSVSVLFGASLVAASMPVMVFCLAIGYAAMELIPSPVFMIMGGIRLTESEEIILGTRIYLIAGGVLTSPIWVIGYLICCSVKSPWKWALDEFEHRNQPVSMTTWILALISLLFLTPFLPQTQREQWLRWRAEKLILAGAFEELSNFTQKHTAIELPPHWDPPPRIGYGETKPELISTALALHLTDPADWFWKLYLDKLKRKDVHFRFESVMNTLDEAQLEGFVELFDTLGISAWHAREIDEWIEECLNGETIRQQRRELLIKIQELCKAKEAEPKKLPSLQELL
jgi:hypothetical protein